VLSLTEPPRATWSRVASRRCRVPRLGVWAWSFVGFVVATIIVVAALSAVSEIALPLTFAAVLAVIFKPLVGILERTNSARRSPPAWSSSA
jgi:predicted PurR-regulated permease PerM